MAGRPTKYAPDVAEKIISALRAGNTLRDSAAYVGVSEDSLDRWRKHYADFAERLTRAEAEATVGHVATIKLAAQGGDWRAAAWWLERRHADDWRERKDLGVKLDDADGGLSDAQRADRLAAIFERAGARAGEPPATAPPDVGAAAGPADGGVAL